MTNWFPPQSMRRDMALGMPEERGINFQVDDEVHDRSVVVGRERIHELHALVVGLLDGTADAAVVQAFLALLRADTEAAVAEIAEAFGRYTEEEHPRLEEARASYQAVLQAVERLEDLCQGPPTISLAAAMQDLETAVARFD